MKTDVKPNWIHLSVKERIEFALDQYPGKAVLTSSFGAQSIVLLDLFQRAVPKMPVWLVDTGFLFEETYRYIDTVRDRYDMDLKIIRPELSPAWVEARYGKLWQGDKDELQRYNTLVKVKPLKHALCENKVRLWFSGLRWQQSYDRAQRQFIEEQNGVMKVHPIIDWSDAQVADYIKQHNLPEHPLVKKGYQSIGDRHSSRPVIANEKVENTRFNGLTRECGIHLNWN